jgi:multiple sugar transport system permease protein
MASSALTTAARRPAPAGRRRSARPYRTAVPWFFLAPALILFVGLLLVPIAYTILLSFRSERVAGGLIGRQHEIFVGLANYRATLEDSEFYHGLLRMLVYGAIVVPVMLGAALVFALLLDSPVARAVRFSRIAIFLPYAVPGIIASLLWGFLYLPATSPFTDLAQKLGLPQPNFFGLHAIFGSVANIAIWGGIGFNMIVLFTGLQAIPREIYEAARIDGCGEFRTAVRIKIPMLAPSLVMTVVFSLIATLQVFNEPTTLRPLTNAISTTWMPLMAVYTEAFVDNDVYAAAATSILIALATLVVSFSVLRLAQKRAFGENP